MSEHRHYVAVTGKDGGVKDITHLKFSVYYSKGGMNYFTGIQEPSAIWCSVQPVERKEGSESFMVFSGKKFLMESATRLNRKKVEAAFKKVEAEAEALARTGKTWEVAQHVMAEKGLDLVQKVS